MTKELDLFLRVVKNIDIDCDVIDIQCPLNLWSVTGGDFEVVFRNAFGFFEDCLEDGEYNGLIKEDWIVEVNNDTK